MPTRGYTLIELLVVLAILGLMVAASVPFLSGVLGQNSGRDEVIRLVSHARNLAIQTASPVTLHIGPDGSRWLLTSHAVDSSGSFQQAVITPGQSGQVVRALRFSPWGPNSGEPLRVRTCNGTYTIRFDAWTGQPRVGP